MTPFNDTITIYNKKSDTEWTRTVVNGVQWSDKTDRIVTDKIISYDSHASVTFPEGTYNGITLDASKEEDIIVYGSVSDVITNVRGHRPSDVVAKYSKAGFIKSVNDNSNRAFLKNIKVVVK